MRGVHLNANYSGTGTTGSSYIGSAATPVVIRGNTMRVYSNYGNAYGVIEEARTGISPISSTMTWPPRAGSAVIAAPTGYT